MALLAYASSLGNGFALDDTWFIVQNEVVTEGRFAEALTDASWPGALEGSGNYRPLALGSFALEWALWGDDPLGFHVVSVVAHAAVSVLVFYLLLHFAGTVPALAGAVFFAIHPVHTEAVANVMGRSELYAAIAYLLACLLYLRARPLLGDDPSAPASRALRLLGLVVLFLLACLSKEIAVTLPAVLIAFEVYRDGEAPWWRRVQGEALTCIGLVAAMACYVIVRWNALGAVTGESPAAGLLSLDTSERIMTALTVWPHYLRLLVFPLDLSSDYSPAVLLMTRQVDLDVLLGAFVLAGTLFAAVRLRESAPLVALGCAWFFIAISPVSNLFVRSDILLAERTLYLPSVGAAFVVAWATARLRMVSSDQLRLAGGAAMVVAGTLLTARTVVRNPTWKDTLTVLITLNEDHPESWMSQRTQAISLRGMGDLPAAAAAWERALEIAPDHYQLLVEAAEFFDDTGDVRRAEQLFTRAIELLPRHPVAYRRMAERRLLRGDGQGAHAVALQGIATAEAEPELWALVSESYLTRGDLSGAVRARRAAIGGDPSATGWRRLAEIYDALERPDEAAAARATAASMAEGGRGAAVDRQPRGRRGVVS